MADLATVAGLDSVASLEDACMHAYSIHCRRNHCMGQHTIIHRLSIVGYHYSVYGLKPGSQYDVLLRCVNVTRCVYL